MVIRTGTRRVARTGTIKKQPNKKQKSNPLRKSKLREANIRKIEARARRVPSREKILNRERAKQQIAKFILGNALKSYEKKGAFIWIPDMREQLKHGAPATFTVGHVSSMVGVHRIATKEIITELLASKKFQQQLAKNNIKIKQEVDKKYYITKIK